MNNTENRKNQLKDGYYLSIYCTVDPLANVYRIQLINRHDQCMALWHKNGNEIQLVHYWELERVTGMKHHAQAWFSVEQIEHVIETLISEHGLTLKDINQVWGTDGVCGSKFVPTGLPYTYHSLCHLFSALLLDSRYFYEENVLAFSVDFGSDYELEEKLLEKEYVGCYSKKGNISYFNIQSPAALWSASKTVFGLEEGSLMALAYATTCVITKEIPFETLDFYNMDNRFICAYLSDIYNSYIKMSPPDFLTVCENYDTNYSFSENIISAIMKQIQSFSIALMDREVERAIATYKIDTSKTVLAFSGGYSLNCPTNSFLMQKYHFMDFVAPPCVNDGGQALGIGLFEFFRHGCHVDFKLQDAFYGSCSYDIESCLDVLRTSEVVDEISSFDASIAADDIINAPIVWFEGKSEIGPRALGHRSLIAFPGSIKVKDRLNEIKKRQNWRPVAPIVLEDYLDEWFEDAYSSPFMLHTFFVRKEKKELVPAIVHIDGSARVQSISNKSKNLERLYEVLQQIMAKTRIPIVCNTSLNDRGEAIIDNPLRAVEFAIQKGIGIVYLNGIRIKLKRIDSYGDQLKTSMPIHCYPSNASDEQRRLNPYNLPLYVIEKITKTAKYRNKFDITTEQGAALAKEFVDSRNNARN